MIALIGAVLAQSLAPAAQSVLALSTYVGSGIDQLTDFRFLPDGRVVITRKTGELMVRKTDGTLLQAGRFQVDSNSEKGLLGVEVDPQFASTHLLFFYYSLASAAGGTDQDRHRVVTRTLGDDNQLSAAETVLLHGLRGPANHDGGGLAIGPDGKLYVGAGDTGCNSGQPPPPPDSRIGNYTGTCLTTANGKILRINLDGSIPSDNPLQGVSVRACDATSCVANPSGTPVTGTPRTEIWAWGFRNPWRFSFDAQTGILWVGDVGEVTYEEIDLVTGGQHYGWPWREGGVGDPVSTCATLGANGGGSSCLDPKYFCQHGIASGSIDGECQSITGGVFVDTASWPAPWRGRYYFGDNSNGVAWTLTPNAARDGFVAGSRQDLADGLSGPVSFRAGPDGNLYIGNYGGSISMIAPGGSSDGGVQPGSTSGCSCNSTGAAALPAALLLAFFAAHRGRAERRSSGR